MANASIGGRLTNLAGEPLPNATVHLNSRWSAASGRVWRIEGTSDDGSFLFDGLESGRYSLMGECSGYHQQQYGSWLGLWTGIDISVDEGEQEQVRDLAFMMSPTASISGCVTQEDGSPGSEVVVQLLRWTYFQGRRRLSLGGAGSGTGPKGEFRIEKVMPGRYFLSAESHPSNQLDDPDEVLVRTFHPSTLNPSLATPIDVAPGAELHGLDLRIRKARGYRATGRVQPPQRFSMHIANVDPDKASPRLDWTPGFLPDARFEFRGVLPGEYILEAWPGQMTPPNAAPIEMHVGRARITVTDRDVDGLVVNLTPPFEIRGRVTIEGVKPPPLLPEPEPPPKSEHSVITFKPADRPWVMLLKSDGIPVNAPGAESREDGTFVIQHVIPGKFRAVVSGPFPDGTFLKSIYLDDRDVTNSEFDLAAKPHALSVVLSPYAATISGIVRDSKGAPVPGAAISCWNPHQPAHPFELPSTSDQKGAFRIRHLPPGEYRLLAWEHIDDALHVDPRIRAAFEARTSTLNLGENSRESMELQAVPRSLWRGF